MLHAMKISKGKATYINRWVRTERWKLEDRAGRSLHTGLKNYTSPLYLIYTIYRLIKSAIKRLLFRKYNAFGTIVSTSLSGTIPTLGMKVRASKRAGNANSALAFHAGRLFALVETTLPYQIKLPGLEALGLHDFDGKLHHPFTGKPLFYFVLFCLDYSFY
jgi:carotenoid cleavage dioxygenase-like enzyme